MEYMILAINPGSTSTKVAVYKNENKQFAKSVEHSTAELGLYKSVAEQYPMRLEALQKILRGYGYEPTDFSAVVGRGGLLPPVRSGAYEVNEVMLERLKYRPVFEHASNLGAMLAYEIAVKAGVSAYIYDPIAVDELEPVARITGLPELPRISVIHALNMRAMALRTAKKRGCLYSQLCLIVVHLGGGISMSVHQGGKMIDIVSDDEGPFSPERAGRLPGTKLAELCFSGRYDLKKIQKIFRGAGGLVAHLDTNKALEVETRIKNGDKEAELVYYAMAYQVAKGIGELATVVRGNVDAIVLTGGIAYSGMLTQWIKERVEFIAPVEVMPGENEMESLAWGALRVLRGEEAVHIYEELFE